jgi:hypothetical protein
LKVDLATAIDPRGVFGYALSTLFFLAWAITVLTCCGVKIIRANDLDAAGVAAGGSGNVEGINTVATARDNTGNID